jgi:hypothetical protein
VTALCEEAPGNPANPRLASAAMYAVGYPSASMLLLVPRYAHLARSGCVTASNNPSSLSNAAFQAQIPVTEFMRYYSGKVHDGGTRVPASVDNGHIPVFDGTSRLLHQGMAANPPDGPGDDARLPWGQLVLDYFNTIEYSSYDNPPAGFTARPYADLQPDTPYPAKGSIEQVNLFNGFLQYGRRMVPLAVPTGTTAHGLPVPTPMPNRGGREIPGRLNIDAAPWMLIAGLPLVFPETANPIYPGLLGYDTDLYNALFTNDPNILNGDNRNDRRMARARIDQGMMAGYGFHSYVTLSNTLARAIVGYRDRRRFNWDPSAPRYDMTNGRTRNLTPLVTRTEAGLTTVLEVANVRQPGIGANPAGYMIDDPEPLTGGGTLTWLDRIKILARIDDKWVTTRSNTFYVYSALTGPPVESNTVPRQFTVVLSWEKVPPEEDGTRRAHTNSAAGGEGTFYLYKKLNENNELHLSGDIRLAGMNATPDQIVFRRGSPGTLPQPADQPFYEGQSATVSQTADDYYQVRFDVAEDYAPVAADWDEWLDALYAGECYVEIHDPGDIYGFIRGQVTPMPRIRHVEMMVDRTNLLDIDWWDVGEDKVADTRPRIIAGPVGETDYAR